MTVRCLFCSRSVDKYSVNNKEQETRKQTFYPFAKHTKYDI